MALSSDLTSLFAKTTNDAKETKKESTAYGKIVKQGDVEYVQLDGSDLLTPITSTTVVKDGDRVMVTIKNHTAIVTGDLTNPSASNNDVVEIGNKISEFEIIIADKVTTKQLEAEIAKINTLVTDELTATNAKIETMEVKVAKIDTLEADNVTINNKLTAHEGEFTTIRADIADFKDVTTEKIDAIEGNFHTLDSDYANFKETTTNTLTANKASINELQTNKLDAEIADIKYANIDFSNIGEAAIEKLFADSGIIEDLIMSDGKVTGHLVGVTITGDLIEGNTVKADKLVIQGEDGLYYKLNVNALGEATASSDEKYQNGLDGSIIVAESITAEKIAVDDLVAFGATIGGFHINKDAIYSGTKNSIDNTTKGLFLGDDGQIAIGDTNNYFKYFIDDNGDYKLEIQTNSIRFATTGATVEETIIELEEDMNEVIADNISQVTETIVTHTTELQQTNEDYVNTSLESYVQKDVYNTEIEDIRSEIQLNSDSFTVNLESRITEINELNNRLQTLENNIAKHFEFTLDGLIIKAGENEMKLQLDNDIIRFIKNGEEFGNWDGIDFRTGNIIIGVNERAQFGNYAYVPRSDDSLMFLNVKGG